MKILIILIFLSHTLSTYSIREYYRYVSPIMRVRVSWCQVGDSGAKLAPEWRQVGAENHVNSSNSYPLCLGGFRNSLESQ